jgi:hypothetical protein
VRPWTRANARGNGSGPPGRAAARGGAGAAVIAGRFRLHLLGPVQAERERTRVNGFEWLKTLALHRGRCRAARRLAGAAVDRCPGVPRPGHLEHPLGRPVDITLPTLDGVDSLGWTSSDRSNEDVHSIHVASSEAMAMCRAGAQSPNERRKAEPGPAAGHRSAGAKSLRRATPYPCSRKGSARRAARGGVRPP